MLDLRDLADELDALTAVDEQDRDTDRIAALVALEDELGDTLRTVGDDYEPTLIPEDEFVEYAQQLADDLGLIDADATWPTNCIDWQRAADELRVDYTSVRFDGDDYLIRSW